MFFTYLRPELTTTADRTLPSPGKGPCTPGSRHQTPLPSSEMSCPPALQHHMNRVRQYATPVAETQVPSLSCALANCPFGNPVQCFYCVTMSARSCIRSAADGHVCCFLFGVPVSKAAENTLARVCGGHVCLGKCVAVCAFPSAAHRNVTSLTGLAKHRSC